MSTQLFTYEDLLTLLAALDDYEQAAADSDNQAELDRATALYHRLDAMRFAAQQPPPPAPAAPRGWFRDPWQQASLRYWDGRQWTPRIRDTGRAVIIRKSKGDTFTNLALTVATCGLWAPVWMLRSADRHTVRPVRRGPP